MRRGLHTSARCLSTEWSYIAPGATHTSRYLTHYRSSLASDLLYMTYNHNSTQSHPPNPALPEWKNKTTDPYAATRKRPRSRTGVQPKTQMTTDKNLIRIEKIVLSSHIKQAPSNKNALIPAYAFFRAISGLHPAPFPQTHLKPQYPVGVQVTRTTSKSASFKIRAGQPCGVKATLASQEAIYDFLETLAEFVFPRLKDWPGVPLPKPSRHFDQLPSSLHGSLTFGLPAEAMALFPQVEMQLDAYPKPFGLYVHVVTNAKGEGAQDRVRALLSGLRVPFVRSA